MTISPLLDMKSAPNFSNSDYLLDSVMVGKKHAIIFVRPDGRPIGWLDVDGWLSDRLRSKASDTRV